MRNRQQERNGWIFGWLGGFVWVPVLAIVLLAQGRAAAAAVGLTLTLVAPAAILALAPWRHPGSTYRRLMAPLYGLVFLSMAWAIWSFGDLGTIGLNGIWSLLLLVPILLPIWLVGERRWQDRED